MFKLINIDKNGNVSANAKALKYLETQKSKATVISILGEARMGKSSLLNIMISKIIGNDIKVFNTGDNLKEQGTYGIDMYHCDNYVFLDCQGVNYQNSSNDVKVMLIAYMLSNMFVVNVNFINNTALKILEPLLLFRNYTNIDDIGKNNIEKPKLCFKIKDYSFDDDPYVPLKETIQIRNDQYDSIRKTLNILFSDDIIATETEPLTRQQLSILRAGKYIEFIKNVESFNICTDRILNQNIGKKVLDKNYAKFITHLCQNINTNRKIDNKDLDTLTLLNDREINAFINSIDPENRIPLQPDGTTDYYVNHILRRKAMYEDIMANFNTTFSHIEPTIKEQYRKIIVDTYEKYHLDAKRDNYTIGRKKAKTSLFNFENNINTILLRIKVSEWELINIVSSIVSCYDCCKSPFVTQCDIMDRHVSIKSEQGPRLRPVYRPMFDIEYKTPACDKHSIELTKYIDSFYDSLKVCNDELMDNIKQYDMNVMITYGKIIDDLFTKMNITLNDIMNQYYSDICNFLTEIGNHYNIIFIDVTVFLTNTTSENKMYKLIQFNDINLAPSLTYESQEFHKYVINHMSEFVKKFAPEISPICELMFQLSFDEDNINENVTNKENIMKYKSKFIIESGESEKLRTNYLPIIPYIIDFPQIINIVKINDDKNNIWFGNTQLHFQMSDNTNQNNTINGLYQRLYNMSKIPIIRENLGKDKDIQKIITNNPDIDFIFCMFGHRKTPTKTFDQKFVKKYPSLTLLLSSKIIFDANNHNDMIVTEFGVLRLPKNICRFVKIYDGMDISDILNRIYIKSDFIELFESIISQIIPSITFSKLEKYIIKSNTTSNMSSITSYIEKDTTDISLMMMYQYIEQYLFQIYCNNTF